MRRRTAALLVLCAVLAPATSVRAAATFEPVATGLSFPSNMAFAPDGRLFFAEKDTGDIRVIRDGELVTDPARAHRRAVVERTGPAGLALDPAFDTQPWIYVYYSDPVSHLNRLARFRADDAGADTRAAAGRAHDRARLSQRRRPGVRRRREALRRGRRGPRGGARPGPGRPGRQDPAAQPRREHAVRQPVRLRQPRVLHGAPELVRAVRRPVDGSAVGDGERAGQRRRGQPHRARRQLRLAGPARSGGRAAVHRSGARLPRRDRPDGVRGVAGRPVLRRVRHRPAVSAVAPGRRPTRTPTWWAISAPASPTSRWDRTAICTSRRPMRSGGSRERAHRRRRRRRRPHRPADASGGGWKTAVAVVAALVLAAGLIARFVAGWRLRRDTRGR